MIVSTSPQFTTANEKLYFLFAFNYQGLFTLCGFVCSVFRVKSLWKSSFSLNESLVSLLKNAAFHFQLEITFS